MREPGAKRKLEVGGRSHRQAGGGLGFVLVDGEVAGPNTPPHAQLDSRRDYGSLWTFGIKGTF